MNWFHIGHLTQKYGRLRLTMDELAAELGMARNTVYNQVSAGTLAVATYVDGGKRWADVRDVVTHLDACQARAKAGGHANFPA